MSVLDLVSAAADILEPDPTPPDPVTVVKDAAGERPFTWQAGHLYVYPIRTAERTIETGSTSRQDFVLGAVFVASGHEEPRMRRSASVSEAIDAKRGAYFAAIRANRHTPPWLHITAAETRPPRTLQNRALALELSGYRIVS